MIVIKIEIWPHGYADRAEEIGRIQIINDGTGSSFKGNYLVRFLDKQMDIIKTKQIKNYDRTKHIFYLLHQAMKNFKLPK